MSKIGIITGYGLNLASILENPKEHLIDTPYGKPSSVFTAGIIHGKEVVILQRHGRKDEIPSFLVNYKANMFVLHEMECSIVLGTSVCGSLQEEIQVGEFVVFDQFIDLTKHRNLTYSDKLPLEKLNHSAFNKPFSDDIRDALIETAVVLGITVHTKGSVMAVDGPRQSTRAESNLYRKWGADVLNTSTAPEAILAHELGIGYGSVSLCTYFDTWRTDIPPATRGEKLLVIDSLKEKFGELIVNTIGLL
jgi:5'-methylthioadenosine phosphorylase